MGANDRIVQHLRLRAPSQQAATRVVNRLEDALRCASLPDAGERLLLVRRLDLGRLPAGGSSQSLSLLIEQCMAVLGGEWVHGDEARAARSDTVFFSSRLQAAQAALRRRALGADLAAWYWPLALPGVQMDASDQTFLYSVVSVLARETSAQVSLPAMVADIVAAGHAPWLLSAMLEETATLLHSGCDVQHHVAQVLLQQRTSAPTQAVRYAWRSLAGRWHQTWIPIAWPVWLHAILRTARWLPETLSQGMVRSEQASRTPDQGVEQAASADSVWSPGGQEHFIPVESLDVMPRTAPNESDVWRSSHFAVPAPIKSEGVSATSDPPVAEIFEQVSEAPFDTARPSRAGGILFLINLLVRLGFPEWQSRHPDAPLCGLILSKALQRLDVSIDDPAWALATSLPWPPPHLARHWQTPEVWCDARIGVAYDAAEANTAEVMASLWLTACRRYLRRVVHIGLFSFLCRAAQLHWSATHLDTRFALGDADLRIRCAALDTDPGWLDWLGRVVTFQYLQAIEA